MESLARISAGGSEALARLVQQRITQMPPEAQDAFDAQILPIVDRFSMTLEPQCAGQENLARMTVSVDAEQLGRVSLVRLFRPDARDVGQMDLPALSRSGR
jgi:hypothetical protein